MARSATITGIVMIGGTTPTIGIGDRRRGEAAEHQRALAADHDEADARGNRDRQRGRISGDERCRVFWNENAVPKPPRQT